ncbi:MAG: response regulator [Gammaproteobacteria bacterium]|nr:MAG: response regulator [Gammaproteobacteria bacterium]
MHQAQHTQPVRMASVFDVSQKVLVVDDDEDTRRLLAHHLSDYQVETAGSGAEALALIQDSGPWAVVVSDYMMPEMDGITLLQELSEREPETVPIMLTAHGDLEVAVRALHEGRIFRFLTKPWQDHQLRLCVDQALSQYRAQVSEQLLLDRLQQQNQDLSRRLEEMKALRRRLQQWADFSPVVIYEAVVDGEAYRNDYVSSNLERLFGFDRIAFVGDPGFWTGRVHPDDLPRLHEAFSRLRSEDSARGECRYRARGGDEQWVEVLDRFRRDSMTPSGRMRITGAWQPVA